MSSEVLLLGGPAGAGKSTLARLWCGRRRVAAHLQLDDVRSLIVAGRADPLDVDDPAQPEQWTAAVEVTCAAAAAFVHRGIDVAVDDLMLPRDVDAYWSPLLAGVRARLVLVVPRLEVVLGRGRGREKDVPERIVREQHAACLRWPPERRLDTSDLSVDQSIDALERVARPLI